MHSHAMYQWCMVLLSLQLFGAGCRQPPELRTLLIQEGDLPSDLRAGPISDVMPPSARALPIPKRFLQQQFTRDDEPAGSVIVRIYTHAEDRAQVYEAIAARMANATSLAGIGERARFATAPPRDQSFDLLFQQCRAIVHIRMRAPQLSAAAVMGYAKRLAGRLVTAVC